MNLDNIDLQGFILALFIRDDGERFLLGSGAYEFKKEQLHFAKNTYQNDIVEVQGNDGLLLAGQVRRPSNQSFSGYIGDATVSKSDIEVYRRNFLAFFRKDYYYKVVYIFADGSAIQRQKGFIVEAPEVKELWQVFPEYNVSLNFEDINYYTYSENDSGQEIYGKNAIIPISSAPTTGGLVWDEYGAVVQEMNWTGDVTVTGTDLEINNPLNYRVAFQDVKLFGNSVQSGSPSISNPASITLVSGVQTITVTDENNNTDTYTINLGSYELNKVWGYTDSIHKSAGSWVLEKQTGKFIINNNLTVVSTSSTTIELVTPVLTIRHNLNYISLAGNAKSDKLSVGNGSNQMYATTNDGRIRIRLSKQFPISALNGTVIYYGLSTPTLTTLSGTLATALDTLLAGELFTGNNVITTTVSAGTEKPTLSFTYYTELDSSEGFVWEEGSGGGPTTVTIEAVDNVYPIWEVVGPAINPQLANLTTNTALTYVGTVNAGQTLKIDMTNKLATLNGTSVISNVNGEWVYFKPGDNRITYTALNNDADPSTIQWQEIVG